jgi:2,3-dihydroxy-p-cumate/2,3-dihydroxybenzoate 3,4-dioxygenase
MIRYKKLGFVALNVSNLARARAWYESMVGLQFNRTGTEGEVYLRADADHHSVVLYQNEIPGLKRVGWQLESDDQIKVLTDTLDRHAIAWRALSTSECAAIGMRHTIRMIEPVTGTILDFFGTGMQQMDAPFRPTVAKLRFLCHIGIGTPHFRQAIDFYERVLNFRTSDEIDGRIRLMRCFPNPLHHSLALAPAPVNTLHHFNLMVSGEDDIIQARARFRENSVPMVWDGHHPPSGNTFLFFRDPDGLPVEYGHGMELFPEVGARPHRVFSAKLETLGDHIEMPNAPVADSSA